MRCWRGYLSGERCTLFAPQTPLSRASFKSNLVLTFCCRLSQVVLEKRPLNGWSKSSSSVWGTLGDKCSLLLQAICDLWMVFLAYVHLALFLALSRSPGNSLVSSCDHSTLASLLCVLCCPRNPQNISQSFHHKGFETCFFILSESNSPRMQRKITFALSAKKRELTSRQRDRL